MSKEPLCANTYGKNYGRAKDAVCLAFLGEEEPEIRWTCNYGFATRRGDDGYGVVPDEPKYPCYHNGEIGSSCKVYVTVECIVSFDETDMTEEEIRRFAEHEIRDEDIENIITRAGLVHKDDLEDTTGCNITVTFDD